MGPITQEGFAVDRVLYRLLVMIAGLSLWKTRGMPSRLPTEVAAFDATKGDAFLSELTVLH